MLPMTRIHPELPRNPAPDLGTTSPRWVWKLSWVSIGDLFTERAATSRNYYLLFFFIRRVRAGTGVGWDSEAQDAQLPKARTGPRSSDAEGSSAKKKRSAGFPSRISHTVLRSS